MAPLALAQSTAPSRLARLLLAASTSTTVAAGASAWAHSMSSDSSSAQPLLVLGLPCGSAW